MRKADYWKPGSALFEQDEAYAAAQKCISLRLNYGVPVVTNLWAEYAEMHAWRARAMLFALLEESHDVR